MVALVFFVPKRRKQQEEEKQPYIAKSGTVITRYFNAYQWPYTSTYNIFRS